MIFLQIQTKYTPIDGQDKDTAPYDPSTSITDQVRASVSSSLRNLRHARDSEKDEDDDSYLDCVLIHSPLDTVARTLDAWSSLESFVPHKIRHLGISNINLTNLEIVFDLVQVKPAIVQNRFHPRNGHDRDVRKFCVEHGIIYEAFWTLTANPHLLKSKPVQKLAELLSIEKEAALYCLVTSLDNFVVLNGTKNKARMQADIDALDRLHDWSTNDDHRGRWKEIFASFIPLIGGD